VLRAPPERTLLHSHSALTGLLVSAKVALTEKGPFLASISLMDGASCKQMNAPVGIRLTMLFDSPRYGR